MWTCCLGLIAQLLKRPPQDILAEVEKARIGLEDIGVEVIMDKPNNSDVILAGTALGILIAKIMSSKQPLGANKRIRYL